MGEEICSCGRAMGFLLECFMCGKSCCIMCVSEGNVSLCLECKLTQLDFLEKHEKKLKQKRHQELMAKCMMCDAPKNKRQDCGFCEDNLRFCMKHIHICEAKTKKGKLCGKLICHAHEFCKHHTKFCKNCTRPIRSLDVVACKHKWCSDIYCPECVAYGFPYREEIGFICKSHHQFCADCHNWSIKLNCIDEYCQTQCCHKCMGFQTQGKIKKGCCSRHRRTCPSCQLRYPRIFAKKLIVPHIGIRSVCSNCYKRDNREFLTLMKALKRKNIKLPRDLRILLWQVLVL